MVSVPLVPTSSVGLLGPFPHLPDGSAGPSWAGPEEMGGKALH